MPSRGCYYSWESDFSQLVVQPWIRYRRKTLTPACFVPVNGLLLPGVWVYVPVCRFPFCWLSLDCLCSYFLPTIRSFSLGFLQWFGTTVFIPIWSGLPHLPYCQYHFAELFHLLWDGFWQAVSHSTIGSCFSPHPDLDYCPIGECRYRQPVWLT